MLKQKNIVLVVAILLMAGLTTAAWVSIDKSGEGHTCPPGFVSSALLEPIQEGENSSKIVSETCVEISEDFSVEVLAPVDPATYKAPDQSELVTEKNETVMGPSLADSYRCVVMLEPIAEGATESKIIDEVCSDKTVNELGGAQLNTLYLVAKFYDRTNYGTLLKEYYGSVPCSSGVSYGRNNLADDGYDNRYESGSAFSNCNLIEVFDFVNHTGPTYACGANCSSFYALNNAVSSWRVKN
jgi:hypothetical protein